MEQSPKICPKCRQANFPIAEFCRHCGEPIFESGALTRSSLLTRWAGHLVDALFWIIDEIVRWWEIARLNYSAKRLRKQRADLLNKHGKTESELPGDSREKLVSLSEDISRLNTREEFLRRKCWAMTPEIILLLVISVFVAGVFWLRPRTDALPISLDAAQTSAAGTIKKLAEYPIQGFSTITAATWHKGRLLIGGDGGLLSVDPVSGITATVASLPPDFYVRDLVSDGQRLLVAGLGGIYAYTDTEIAPLYPTDRLPVPFINKVTVVSDGHLLGTLGGGLLKARQDFAVVVLDTAALSISGMAWLGQELWLMHERGLMSGDGTSFSKVDIPVLSGKKLSTIAATANSLYLGTDQGIIAAIRTNQSWIWTPLGAGAPIVTTDMITASDTLLVSAADGLFRLQPGRDFEKLSADPRLRKLALWGNTLAAIAPNRIFFYQFDSPTGVNAISGSIVPQIGTFAQNPVPAVTPAGQPVVAPAVPGVAPVVPTVAPAPLPVTQNNLPLGTTTSGSVLSAPLPEQLKGPVIKASFWDGSRLYLGTSNAGLWILANGQWQSLSTENGRLSDNQINAVFPVQNQVFFYGWVVGLMKLQGDTPVSVLNPGQSRNLLGISGDPASPHVLFRNGKISQVVNGTLQDKFEADLNLRKSLRGLEMIAGKPYLITDNGVATRADSGEWPLTRFDDTMAGSVLFSAQHQGVIYLARSNGGVFSFTPTALTKLGNLSGAPIGLSVSGNTVFVADQQNIFSVQGTTLAPAGRYSSSFSPTGFQAIRERQTGLIFSGIGPETVNLNL